MGLFTKIFGTYSEHQVKKLEKIAAKIEALATTYKNMTDDELRGMTEVFKKRLAAGETLDDILPEAFAAVREADDRILGKEDINPSTDLFFIDHNGKHIATIAAIYHPEKKIGEVHMVGMLTEYRGKGLGKHLNNIALERLSGEDYKYIFLTTDEWRKGAVKSYLSSGFVPVEYDINMEYRWSQVLEEYGIDSVDMVYEDATPFRKIYRTSLEKKVRIGVFGAGRGKTMMNYCMTAGDAQLVAVCDSYKPALDKAKENTDAIMPGYTHLQRAQPITFAHHLMACSR